MSGIGVTGVELRRVRLPLVAPFDTAAGSMPVRELVLVRVVTPDAEGWGECAALPSAGYDGEDVDGAWRALAGELVPALLAGAPVTGAHRTAAAALDTALLDARLRAEGRSLALWLGATRDRVPAGVAVGLHRSVGALVDEVTALAGAGYRRVKVKIGPGWDVEPVAAVRAACPDLPLTVDANGAYSLADIDGLAALDDFGLLLVEQPLPPGRLDDHARLAARLRTPVCLDEDVTSAAAAQRALDMGACSVVCVKPGRVGGLAEARRVVEACEARGAGCWVGGMVEAGLGKATTVALAALAGCTLPGDLPASDRWFARDLTEPWVLDGGELGVPAGPGLGVEPRPDALAESTVEAVWLRP